MITPELPPLPNPPLEYRHEGCTYIDRESFLEWHDQHAARERILLARVAELDLAVSIARDNAVLLTSYWKQATDEASALRNRLRDAGLLEEEEEG